MWNNTDMKPMEICWENDQRSEFRSTMGPKNWAFDAHIVHICDIQRKCFNKIVENFNLDLIGGPK